MRFVEEKDQSTNTFIPAFNFGRNLILVVLSYDRCYSNTAVQNLMPKSTCQPGNVLSLCDFIETCSV